MKLDQKPEVIGDWIHIPVRNKNLFKDGTFRTFDISKSRRIRAVGAKLKKPPAGQAGALVVQKYLFHKDKWTVKTATQWVKDHGKSIEEILEDFMENQKSQADVKNLGQDKTTRIEGTKESPVTKTFDIAGFKATTENGKVILRGYANTKGHKDRYGDIPMVFEALRKYVYEIKDFLKNPVMLLDHRNQIAAVAGSFPEIVEDDIGLRFVAEFSGSDHPDIVHARTVYLEGHAKALSISGRWHFEDNENPNHLTYAEIYHISPVGVGADPDALGHASVEVPKPKKEVPQQSEDVQEDDPDVEIKEGDKTVVPYKRETLAEEGIRWDAAREMAVLWNKGDRKRYARAHVWFDGEKPENKGAYKLPHHNSGLATVWKGVASAMAVLLGARGGVDIPLAEKKRIHSHLTKHYKDFDKPAPPFKSVAEIQENGEIIFRTHEEIATRGLVSLRDALKKAQFKAGIHDLKKLLEKTQGGNTNG